MLELVRARVAIRGIEGGGALDERPQLLGTPGARQRSARASASGFRSVSR